MKLFNLFRRPERQSFGRRSTDRIAACRLAMEPSEEDRREQEEMKQRLNRIARELDVVRRTTT